MSRRGPRRAGIAAGALGVVALLAGCSSAPEPATPAASPAPEAIAPAPPTAPREPEPATGAQEVGGTGEAADGDDLTVVIDPGAEDTGPVSLAAAAAAERQRREQAPEPVAVIDNQSLADYRDVEITIPDRPVESSAGPEEVEALEAAAADERYWRERVLGLRLRWREAYDSIERLEGEAAELRRRFYAEDDPFYRDTQIKPAWDRALEELRRAQLEVSEAQAELRQALEEGRAAGALAGWLREGIDFEPETPEEPERPGQTEDSGIYEPEEVRTIDDRGRRRDDGG